MLLILFSDLSCQDDGANKNEGHTANDFSHVAILGIKRPYGVRYEHLGSLINKQYVLTAGYIARFGPIVEVVLGVHNSFEEADCTRDNCTTGKVPFINYFLCISTSFQRLRVLESSSKYFFWLLGLVTPALGD